MFGFKSSRVAGAVLAAALALSAVGASPQTTCTPRHGYGHGDWDLPSSSGGQGAVSGVFVIPNVPGSDMQFVATLTDVPSPCLSCIEGTIDGTLASAAGNANYEVRGHYFGGWFSGAGQWEARIFPANSPGALQVGRIRGDFKDPPSHAGPGRFSCRWRICD